MIFKEKDLVEFNNKIRGFFLRYRYEGKTDLAYITIDKNKTILVETKQLRKLEQKYQACRHCICLNCKRKGQICKILMCKLCKNEKEALEYVTRHFNDIMEEDVLVSCRVEEVKDDWIQRLYRKINSYNYECKILHNIYYGNIIVPKVKYCPVCGTKNIDTNNFALNTSYYCKLCGFSGEVSAMNAVLANKYQVKGLIINEEKDYGLK